MRSDWSPALYTPQDLSALVALSQIMPGKAADVTPEYVRWMHDGNPAGLPLIAVARNEGASEIMGQVWLMPLRIQVGGEIQLGALSFYGLVDPAYHRQGIFTRLVSYCSDTSLARGIQFSYGFPNHRSFPVFIRRLDWAHLGNAREYICPINLPRLIQRRFQRQIRSGVLASSINLMSNAFFQPKPLSSAARKFNLLVSSNTAGLGGFWERLKGKYPVMVVRDAPFIEWRYFRVPDRNYLVWVAKEGQAILAYLVLRRVVIQGVNCGMVVDFLVEPTEDGRLAGEFLLVQAREYFTENDIDVAGCLLVPGSEEIKLLKRQGFILCPTFLQSQPHPIILETHDNTLHRSLLHHLPNWFLSLGDFDAV